jgi:MFS family permease
MSKRSLVVITASFCTVLIGFAIRSSYGILLPEMLPSLMISKAEAGLIYGSFFIAYTIFSPVLGLLADRVNIRITLTVFLGILGIGTFLMGYSSSLVEAILFFLLAGIGSAACWSPVIPLVDRWANDKRRGLTLALVDVGASLGTAVSSLIIPLLVVAYNWRMGWKGLGVLAFFMAGVNFLLIRDYPAGDSELKFSKFNPTLNKPVNKILMEILRDYKFLIMGVAYLFIGFSVIIPITFITTYAVEELRLRYDVATRLITITAIASIIGKLVLSSISDALGRIKTIIICEILTATGILGMIYSPTVLTLHLSMAIFGFGYGAIWPLYAVCAPDYFSKGSSGFVVGFWTLFLGIGLILSPVIAGWLADETGIFMWSFILAIGAALISTFLLFLVQKKVSSVTFGIA